MNNELKPIVTKISTLMGLANNPDYTDIKDISTKGEHTYLVSYNSGVKMSISLAQNSRVMVNTTDGDVGVVYIPDSDYACIFNTYIKDVEDEDTANDSVYISLLSVFGKDKLKEVIHDAIVEYAKPLMGGDIIGKPILTVSTTCTYVRYPNGDIYYVSVSPFDDGMSVIRNGCDNSIIIPSHTPGGALRHAALLVLGGLYKINNDYFHI